VCLAFGSLDSTRSLQQRSGNGSNQVSTEELCACEVSTKVKALADCSCGALAPAGYSCWAQGHLRLVVSCQFPCCTACCGLRIPFLGAQWSPASRFSQLCRRTHHLGGVGPASRGTGPLLGCCLLLLARTPASAAIAAALRVLPVLFCIPQLLTAAAAACAHAALKVRILVSRLAVLGTTSCWAAAAPTGTGLVIALGLCGNPSQHVAESEKVPAGEWATELGVSAARP
jgi:hypothetical protein